MKKLQLIFCFLVCSNYDLLAQSGYKTNWITNPVDQAVFIENQGQFKPEGEKIGEILYQAQLGNVTACFTARGIVYRYCEPLDRENEKEQEREKPVIPKTHYLSALWEGASANTTIEAKEKETNFCSYLVRGRCLQAGVFKILRYRNIYPGIDIEYFFPEGKEGIKYSVIIHPGADASQLKLKYEGSKGIYLDKQGNIFVKSKLGNFTDHAPVSYDEQGIFIKSDFELVGNTVSFKLPPLRGGGALIDPWVTNPNFTTLNKGYDIKVDNSGNVFVEGGGSSGWSLFQLKKFTPGGTLLWTASTTNASCYQDFDLDAAGNAYVLDGQSLIRISSAGVITGNNAIPNAYEPWRINVNCSNNRIYVAGMSDASTNQTFTEINSTGSVILNNQAGLAGIEVRSQCIDYGSGNIYGLTVNTLVSAAGPATNRLVKLDPVLNIIYNIQDGFLEDELGVKYGPFLQPFNGIAVDQNSNNLFTYDGMKIIKRDKTNGNQLGMINVPNTVFDMNSGICVDRCGNVYVGTQNSINKYSPNLSLVASIATTGAVYDVCLGIKKDEILACGNGFVMDTSFINQKVTVTPSGGCLSCNGTATVDSCGISASSYSWSNGQTTQTATGLCPGTYTVIVSSPQSVNCRMYGDTIIALITGGGTGLTLSCSGNNALCGGANGSATAAVNTGTSPYTYSWNNGQTTQTISGLSAGTYSVVVTDASGCTGVDSVSITSSGSVTALAGPNSTICAGQTVSISASGGTNYSWSTGATTTAISLTPSSSSTYSVIVSSGNCSDTAFVTVSITSPPVAVASSSTVCAGQNAILTASGGGTYLWSTGATTSSISLSSTSSSTYSVVVSFGSCADTANAILTIIPSPLVSLGKDPTLCAGQSTTLDAGNSGAGYIWSTGETSQLITVSSPGTYWVIVGMNNCLARDTVVAFTAPGIHLPDSSLCTSAPIVLNPGSGATSYYWSNGSTTQTISVDSAGTYWVTAMFGNCAATAASEISGMAGMGSLYVPNAFTPNEDNLNEVFLAKGTGIVSFNMSIFDRWGNLIFVSDDVSQGWGGIVTAGGSDFNGDSKNTAQEDVYVWKINYTTECFSKTHREMMGHVSIVK